MTKLKESDIEQYLVDRVKSLGGEVRKVKWIGRRSAPDRLVMLPEIRKTFRHDGRKGTSYINRLIQKGRTIWIELKAPGKKATFPADFRERAQAREHERMRTMGQRVVVVDSFEGVDQVLS